MIGDVVAHMGLELVGSGTTACIMFGCRNASHQHGRAVRFFAHNRAARLALNGVLMLIFSTITVKLLG